MIRGMMALVAVALVLCAQALRAEDASVPVGPPPVWAHVSDPLSVPDDARGLVYLRRQNVEVHFDKSGQSSFNATLIRILHPNALQLGNIALTWNPAAGAPMIHWLKVRRNGVERDVLASTHFEILRREDQLEAAMLTGVLTATLRVPDLRVGDELDIAYTVPIGDPTFGPTNAGLLFLAPEPMPGRIAMRLSWEDGQKPNYRFIGDIASMTTESEAGATIEVDSAPPLTPPKDAPARYLFQRALEFSSFADWSDLSKHLAPLFAKASQLAPNSPLHEEVAQIAAAHPDAAGRAAAALKLVQQQIRYVYVGLNGGNFTPASADQTWERRYGDCKGKAVLLLALLRELGVQAEAVLADNSGDDDGIGVRLPNPNLFNHVLVRATIDGKRLWLDGTFPPVFVGTERPLLPYKWVLPLSDAGETLEQLPWQPFRAPLELTLNDIDASAGLDSPAKVTVTRIVRGPEALATYYQFSAVTESQLENSLRQSLEGSKEWDTIDKVSWRFDQAAQASVLTISGTGPLDWDKSTTGERSMSLPGGGFYPPERRQRASSQEQSAPYYQAPEFSCDVTSFRFPANASAKHWTYNSSFDTSYFGSSYRRRYTMDGNAITMLRAKRTLAPEITAQEAAKDNARLAKFEDSQAVITYDQRGTTPMRVVDTFPATFEVDWVADPSPCLGRNAAQ